MIDPDSMQMALRRLLIACLYPISNCCGKPSCAVVTLTVFPPAPRSDSKTVTGRMENRARATVPLVSILRLGTNQCFFVYATVHTRVVSIFHLCSMYYLVLASTSGINTTRVVVVVYV